MCQPYIESVTALTDTLYINIDMDTNNDHITPLAFCMRDNYITGDVGLTHASYICPLYMS